ncbi:hypothetical protein SGLAM104S_03221 [Streptomyces glaucescens]
MAVALRKKQKPRSTMGPEAPLNSTIPKNFISIRSKRASKRTTRIKDNDAEEGRPMTAAKCCSKISVIQGFHATWR